MWQSLLFGAGCVPVLILLAAVSIERWQRKQRGERQPLSEKLLRPAGYGLQRWLEVLNDSFNNWFMGSFLFSLLAIGVFAVTPKDAIGGMVFLIGFGLAAGVCAVMTWRTLFKIRACRSGWLGEQAVAEELQSLLSLNFQVFHDVPGKDKWNIDHVAVGPSGVFAIETKYRTKRPGKANARDNEATFDGSKIQFPSSYDVDAPKQAEASARWLATMLSKATGERVTVQPIVALPGWWVTLKAKSDVKVLSGKQVSGFIAKEPVRLSDEAIKRISYQLEQRCRDVEF